MHKKAFLNICIGVGVIALLACGAFMAMRLVNAQTPGNGWLGGLLLAGDGGNPALKLMSTEIPAPELPRQAADLSGRVISVKDNSVFVAQVGLDNISVRRLLQQPTPAGPYTEVVVLKDTKIYRDATYDSVPAPSAGSAGSAMQQVQQKLDLVGISAITATYSYVQVWGQRRGDRIDADIIALLGPAVASGAGGH